MYCYVNDPFCHLTLHAGVGRLLAEASLTPIVIPFYHIGMDNILPNRYPYIPHFFQVWFLWWCNYNPLGVTVFVRLLFLCSETNCTSGEPHRFLCIPRWTAATAGQCCGHSQAHHWQAPGQNDGAANTGRSHAQTLGRVFTYSRPAHHTS